MHVAFVPLAGLRVVSPTIRDLGVRTPDLRRRGSAVAGLPALGLLTLAGMLPDDTSCSWHPASTVDDDLLQALAAARPELVAVSCTTASAEEAWRLGDGLRELGLRGVVGGLHATACPAEALEHFDAVVVGDGEAAWPGVLASVAADRLEGIHRGRWRPGEDDWPLPRFDLHRATPPRWTVQTQRGCPFACDFCGASRLLGPPRPKPLAVLRRELEDLQARDRRPVLELADDNTFAGRDDAPELLGVLEDSGALWFTEADWRLGERPDLLERLAAAGCVQVLVGIESRVFRYPGMGDKDAAIERVMRAVGAIQDAGVVVHGCLIVGADGETHASMDRLVDFVLKSTLAEVQVTLQTPFPGTGLRRRLEREGRLLADRGWSHHTLFDVTYRPDRMSPDELQEGFHDVLARIHAPGPVRRRAARRRSVWRRHARLRPDEAENLVAQ